ncbi:hypothetical protein [Variovorax sp. OV084]|jgi:hypothetical protein|uniref:hypothetical protein n=1 Tax=Variovorax sp. OV084 TaxID=1882777 RepID=UPI0008CDF0A8|nr:hypothetical protein [Variovorax sp. OV084]SET78159.1 hypothetical protein SAMN05443580_106278 [Variovorax sp. OV084]
MSLAALAEPAPEITEKVHDVGMDDIVFSQTPEGLSIEGYPDAVKVVKVGGEKAWKLADFSLHINDLKFSRECLEVLNAPAESLFLRQALWRSAVIHYTKCFATGVRRKLTPGAIYAGQPPLALEAQKYFLELRNKHLAHDISNFLSVEVGAGINKEGQEFKVARVFCPVFEVETLNDGNFNNLKLLVDHAIEWVDVERDRLCVAITSDLEKESWKNLIARDQMTFTAPSGDVRDGRAAQKYD